MMIIAQMVMMKAPRSSPFVRSSPWRDCLIGCGGGAGKKRKMGVEEEEEDGEVV
jgi:hypothetical protein